MSTTCKEQCSTCKCIVKERIINDGNKDDCDDKKSKDCSALYKQLGSCLNECMMEKCKEAQRKRKDKC